MSPAIQLPGQLSDPGLAGSAGLPAPTDPAQCVGQPDFGELLARRAAITDEILAGRSSAGFAPKPTDLLPVAVAFIDGSLFGRASAASAGQAHDIAGPLPLSATGSLQGGRISEDPVTPGDSPSVQSSDGPTRILTATQSPARNDLPTGSISEQTLKEECLPLSPGAGARNERPHKLAQSEPRLPEAEVPYGGERDLEPGSVKSVTAPFMPSPSIPAKTTPQVGRFDADLSDVAAPVMPDGRGPSADSGLVDVAIGRSAPNSSDIDPAVDVDGATQPLRGQFLTRLAGATTVPPSQPGVHATARPGTPTKSLAITTREDFVHRLTHTNLSLRADGSTVDVAARVSCLGAGEAEQILRQFPRVVAAMGWTLRNLRLNGAAHAVKVWEK